MVPVEFGIQSLLLNIIIHLKTEPDALPDSGRRSPERLAGGRFCFAVKAVVGGVVLGESLPGILVDKLTGGFIINHHGCGACCCGQW